jgi:hypothetical protein
MAFLTDRHVRMCAFCLNRHWNTWGSMASASPQFELGAREFPKLRQKLVEIGAMIKAGNAARSASAGGYGGLGRRPPRN